MKARPDIDQTLLEGESENSCPLCGLPVDCVNAIDHIEQHYGKNLPLDNEVGKKAEWYRQLLKILKEGEVKQDVKEIVEVADNIPDTAAD